MFIVKKMRFNNTKIRSFRDILGIKTNFWSCGQRQWSMTTALKTTIRWWFVQNFVSNTIDFIELCLYHDCFASFNVFVKNFARWYCASRFDKMIKRFNFTIVKNILKKFFSDFVRVTRTNISDEYRKNIYVVKNLVMLKKEFFINKIVGAKHFGSTRLHHHETTRQIHVRRRRSSPCHCLDLDQIRWRFFTRMHASPDDFFVVNLLFHGCSRHSSALSRDIQERTKLIKILIRSHAKPIETASQRVHKPKRWSMVLTVEHPLSIVCYSCDSLANQNSIKNTIGESDRREQNDQNEVKKYSFNIQSLHFWFYSMNLLDNLLSV